MTYKLRTGDHKIEREIASLIESEFPEFEDFWNKHLEPLKKDGSWRNNTIEYLEYIGMANFAILKSINVINRNKTKIDVGDPDQSFKTIYFHFGLIADCVENLSRNIALTQHHLKIIKIDKKRRTKKELIANFKNWFSEEYSKNYKSFIQMGRPIIHYPRPNIKYTSVVIAKNARKEYDKLISSLRKYRNFYTHNPGVDIIKKGNELFVINRDHVKESRSWSELRNMLQRSPQVFINPIIQVNNDLKEVLSSLRVLWKSFDAKMTEIENHKNFKKIFIYQRIRLS